MLTHRDRYCAVAAGAALGALARVLLAHAAPHPTTTLLVNVTGSLLAGLLAPLLHERPLLALALTTGLLGGFTTFSTYALDVVRDTGPAYAVATVVGCILAAVVGLVAGTALAARQRPADARGNPS